MTAIVAFFANELPIVIGDILLSGPERSTDVNIPTIGDTSLVFPAGSGYAITGIAQKVAVLSPDLVVAWAGHAVAARTVISELRQRILSRKLTQHELDRFLNEDVPKTLAGLSLSLVGFLRDQGQTTMFRYNAYRFEVPRLGEMYCAGSGTSALASQLEQWPAAPEMMKGDLLAGTSEIAFALGLTGTLMQSELATATSLMNFYGGGYEVATMMEDGFAKMNDLTFVFWRVVCNAQGVTFYPPILYLKVCYELNRLILRSRRPEPDGTTGRHRLTDTLHEVSAIFEPFTSRMDLSEGVPTMHSRFLCSYMFVEHGGAPEVLCRVDYDPGGSPLFEFCESPSEPTAKFRKDFLDAMFQSIRSRYVRP